jgi:hypothetical protein
VNNIEFIQKASLYLRPSAKMPLPGKLIGHQKIILLFLILTLFWPVSLAASSVAIKLSLGRGWPAVREVNHVLHTWQESLKIQADTLKTWSWQEGVLQDLKQQVEFAASLEFNLSRFFSLGLTSGYAYGHLGEDQVRAIIDRPVGKSLFIQQVKIGTLPFCLEALFHLPFSSRWEFYGGGGGGIVWLNFTQREGIKLENASTFTYPAEINAHGSSQLVKTILGFVYHLRDISIFVEGNYHWAKLSNLTGEDKNGQQGNLYFLEERQPDTGYWEAKFIINSTEPASPDIRKVRLAQIDLSGFSLRIGLKINF